MADATVLKTVEGNLVRVRLPSSAPTTPQINLWGVLFFESIVIAQTHVFEMVMKECKELRNKVA